MKTTTYPGCKKITIEHEGGTETFVIQGTARIDTHESGVLEVRTFLVAAKDAKGASHGAAPQR